jgi:hypothetical protein
MALAADSRTGTGYNNGLRSPARAVISFQVLVVHEEISQLESILTVRFFISTTQRRVRIAYLYRA